MCCYFYIFWSLCTEVLVVFRSLRISPNPLEGMRNAVFQKVTSSDYPENTTVSVVVPCGDPAKQVFPHINTMFFCLFFFFIF